MPVCLALAGALMASLPTEAFGLVWSHSVERTEWREEWVVDGDRLRLVEAAVRGSGAGMEPPADATLSDGTWRWAPEASSIPGLVLANSAFAGDYRLCWSGSCRPLASLLPPEVSGPIELYACADSEGSLDIQRRGGHAHPLASLAASPHARGSG